MLNTPENTILPDPVIDELRRKIKASGSQKAAADELEISPSLITEILQGRRTASPSLLEKLGLVKIVVHVKSEKASDVFRAIETVINAQKKRSVDERELAVA